MKKLNVILTGLLLVCFATACGKMDYAPQAARTPAAKVEIESIPLGSDDSKIGWTYQFKALLPELEASGEELILTVVQNEVNFVLRKNSSSTDNSIQAPFVYTDNLIASFRCSRQLPPPPPPCNNKTINCPPNYLTIHAISPTVVVFEYTNNQGESEKLEASQVTEAFWEIINKQENRTIVAERFPSK